MKRINEKIGSWLIKKGNSKTKLANILSISPATLNKRINGSSPWRWDEIVAMSELFECSMDEFMQ